MSPLSEAYLVRNKREESDGELSSWGSSTQVGDLRLYLGVCFYSGHGGLEHMYNVTELTA